MDTFWWRIDWPQGLGCQGEDVVKAEVGVVSLSTTSSLDPALEITVGGGSARQAIERLIG